jgi:hypothetical protein
MIRQRIWRWSWFALISSILFTTICTGIKVTAGYRGHRDALVRFARDVRGEAEQHHWHYEVISTVDEGLLLYLRRLHFVRPEAAITEWNRGNIDALVVPENLAPGLMQQLHAAALSQLRSRPTSRDGTVYVLITN